VPHCISIPAARSCRVAIFLAAVLAAAAVHPVSANTEAAPPPSENAPLRFVTRAAEMRAESFRTSRAAAETAVQRAEAGHCGPAVQRRTTQFREIVVSADETAAKAAAAMASNPGRAASGYVQADKILQRLLDAAGTWRCGEAP